MEVKIVRGVIHAMTWMVVGMVMMARFFCNHLVIDVTSPLYIGWDTVAFTFAALVAIQVLVALDPSFKD
jgi:hypothetical protein